MSKSSEESDYSVHAGDSMSSTVTAESAALAGQTKDQEKQQGDENDDPTVDPIFGPQPVDPETG
eukprot:CAMPEP_0184697666 /NCGR_PEP_ID=MMETSP0313-20130426/4566_1 /TAXON_ID=2792 /ORGANISM="Porphyridium aerugineum, Strain SAG 1380-2" /LENGTH=63 /DNA_ID=CAMNT_0027156495 /DNA_START=185 /DNA_END=373 /DNA_ORIENTATION=-